MVQTKKRKKQQPRKFHKKSIGKQKTTKKKQRVKPSVRRVSKHGKLKIIVLGGQEEVGRNMTIFEYGSDIVILDMGMQFPEEDMHGIDYIIPNIDYLRGKEKNIKAVIFSHGHLDHIGAAPILLEKLGYPLIIGRPLTIAMVKHRQEDYNPSAMNQLKTIQIKKITDKFNFGKINISFFQIDHSIMDAVGVIVQTPTATVLHPGDWTLEKDSRGKPILNYGRLAKLKRPTILMLESLGAIDVRPSTDHYQMHKNLTNIIRGCKGRLIIGTFSSQIERINWIIQTAEKLGKKVAVDGYSMKINVEIAKKFGYVVAKKGTLIKIDQAHNYPDNKLIVLATGAQGEGRAVLSRIISGNHRHIKIKKTDTIVLSSSVIPGNESTIQKLKDGLYRQTDNVIHNAVMDIHVSGHGNQSDIIWMLKNIKPDYFIPTYAFYYMHKEAGNLAKKIGMKDNQILILDNGQIAEFDRSGGKATNKKVNTDYVFVDGLGIGDVSNIILRERGQMGGDGMFVVIATINKSSGKIMGNPDIISRGFVYMKDNKELIEQTRQRIKKILQNKDLRKPANESYIKGKIRKDVGDFLFKKTMRRPLVLPVILEV